MNNNTKNKIKELKIQAQGQWISILSALAPTLNEAISKTGKHVPCPIHGGKDGFRLFENVNETGGGVCNTCQDKTDGFAILQWANGWSLREAQLRVDEFLNGPQSHQLPKERAVKAQTPSLAPAPQKDHTYVVEKILKSTATEPTEAVKRYFSTRGLEPVLDNLPQNVRSARALPLYVEGKVDGTYPALVAPITKGEKIVGVTRLYLTQEGDKLYKTANDKIIEPRQMKGIAKGAMSGGAVKFQEATEVLHLGEGIETMLPVWHSIKEPTWACCTAGLLAAVDVPEHVKIVYIWADKDRNKAGQTAAEKLKERLEKQEKEVQILVPPYPLSLDDNGWDWLDVYNFSGAEAIKHSYKNINEPEDPDARTSKKVYEEVKEAKQTVDDAQAEIAETKLLITETKEKALIAETKEEQKEAKKQVAAANTARARAEYKLVSAKAKLNELKTEYTELRTEEKTASQEELAERVNDPSYVPTFTDEDKDTIICSWLKNTPILKKNAYDSETDQFFSFNGRYWQEENENGFMREVDKALTIAMPGGYNSNKLSSVNKMLKIRVPEKPERNKELVGFANGVFNLKKRTFSPHNATHGLLSCSDISYDENKIECPNFMKWLASAAQCATEEETDDKRLLIGALFYYAVFRKTEWSTFFEVVGEGGTGKSVLLDILAALCGQDNIGAAELTSIEKAEGFGLEHLIHKSVLSVAECQKYTGDATTLKAITGNDPVLINRKYRTAIAKKLDMPVVIVGNQPMNITDKSSGLFRRRIVIRMDNVIPDNEKDYMLSEKLKAEASAIMNWLLLSFDDETVLETINKAKNNREKLLATASGDALFSWMLEAVEIQDSPEAITKTGGNTDEKNRTYERITTQLYANYQEYTKYHGFKQQLSIVKFSNAVESAAHRKLDKPYTFVNKTSKKGKGAHIYGIKINPEAEHCIQKMEDENLSRFSLDTNQSF